MTSFRFHHCFPIVLLLSLVAVSDSQINDPNLDQLLQNSRAQHDLIYNDDDDDDDERDMNVQVSYINRAFYGRQTFTCPLVKGLLATGISAANLSPEDIDVVSVMGDALSTGVGLWPGSVDIEFRGAVFTTGGDANIDGLVTFANILQVFNPKLEGQSHGMGDSQSLPHYQLNVAATGAETDHMPNQAEELVERIRGRYTADELHDYWILTLITIGTEEICAKCEEPSVDALRQAIITLRHAIPRLFVVVVGPIHVARSSQLTYNLLQPRCACLKRLNNSQLRYLQRVWRNAFRALEDEFAARHYANFTILTIPQLTLESRFPEQLLVPERPLLNRKGHTYASKWLWNRLISGSKYNASRIPLSEDAYYCPSLGCPFFRTPENRLHCVITTRVDYEMSLRRAAAAIAFRNAAAAAEREINGARVNIRHHPFLWTVGLVVMATGMVFAFGTIFFCHGMNATNGRFEQTQGV